MKKRLQQINDRYKKKANFERRAKVFEEGELVRAHLRKERFRRGTDNKLKYKRVGLCRILRKISENAYKLELPKNLNIFLMFNVAYLYEFREGEKSDEAGTRDEWKQQLPIKLVEEMEEILATRIGKKPRQKEYLEYLIKWKNRDIEDASWVSEQELAHLQGFSNSEAITT